MSYRFQWKGGAHKPTEHASYKFYLFAMLDDAEVIYFEAKKRGIIYTASFADTDRESEGFPDTPGSGEDFMSQTKYLKIFMSQSGFGLRKSFYSFFFCLDRKIDKVISIRPFGMEHVDHYFRGRGRFLTTDEVRQLVGEDSDTFRFYSRQTYLSRTELQKHVTLETLSHRTPTRVRNIRI